MATIRARDGRSPAACPATVDRGKMDEPELGLFEAIGKLFGRGDARVIPIPDREFRPDGVESLSIGGISRSQSQILRHSHATIKAALMRMPGGVPRTVDDIKMVLPHINPLGYTENCEECTLAV